MYFIIFFDTKGEVTDVWRFGDGEDADYRRCLKQLETSNKIYQYGWF